MKKHLIQILTIYEKLLSLVFCGLLLFGCSDKYDDSALRNDLNDLENRVAKLEELCKQMNTNISSLQKIVDALQDNLSISKVEQISDGYIIYFQMALLPRLKMERIAGLFLLLVLNKIRTASIIGRLMVNG